MNILFGMQYGDKMADKKRSEAAKKGWKKRKENERIRRAKQADEISAGWDQMFGNPQKGIEGIFSKIFKTRK